MNADPQACVRYALINLTVLKGMELCVPEQSQIIWNMFANFLENALYRISTKKKKQKKHFTVFSV